MTDPTTPANLTLEERNALALARAELQMLSDLVEQRRSKGLSQQDIADAIGRDKSAVSRFERLDSDPRLSTVRRYARAVGAMVTYEVSNFAHLAPQPAGESMTMVPASDVGLADVADFAAAMARHAERGNRTVATTPEKVRRLQAIGG